jgi:hypothetical protein
MRNNRNSTIIGGLGFSYRVNEYIGFTLEARSLRMGNVVSKYSHENNPLQDSPLYYVDNDMFLRQISLGVGVSVSIGYCPKLLGFFK